MTKKPLSQFEREFLARVKAIREATEWTQKQMAQVLGVPLERYKKYETRTPLPHEYVAVFCRVAGVTEAQLFDLDLPVARLPIRRPAETSERRKRH